MQAEEPPLRPPARPPWVVVALAAVGAALFVVPLLGLVIRAPWRHAWVLVSAPEVRTALRLSLVCSLSATAISAVLGLPLAWVQARLEFPGRSLLRAVTINCRGKISAERVPGFCKSIR